MISGVGTEVWLLFLGQALINAFAAVLLCTWTAHRAYRRGHNAAVETNEALALGRMMERAKIDADEARQVARDITEGWGHER